MELQFLIIFFVNTSLTRTTINVTYLTCQINKQTEWTKSHKGIFKKKIKNKPPKKIFFLFLINLEKFLSLFLYFSKNRRKVSRLF